MQLPITYGKDPVAGRLTVYFQTGDGGFHPGGRHCDMVVLSSGEAPSYAIAPMPVKNFGPGQWDEVAPTVALQNGGPGGTIRLRTPARVRCEIGSASIPVLNGYAVSFSHQLGEDSLIAEIYDAKWVLGKFTCYGRLVWDPSINKVYWDLASDLVYNNLGYPDCLDHPLLGPVHAPCHRYGYKNDFSDSDFYTKFEDFVEPAPGEARTRARSWRSQDAVRDLRNRFVIATGGARPAFPINVGQMELPETIIWPPSLGTGFGTDRTLKDFALSRNGDSLSLLQALQGLARKAGAFDLYVEANDDGSSTLGFCDMNPKSFTGTRFITAQYASGIGEAANSPIVVKGGNVRESFINGFDEVLEVGDAPANETMVSMAMNPGSSQSPAPFTVSLEPAWSDEDEQAFRNYVVKFGGGSTGTAKGSQFSFQSACRRWPLVFCAYRIKLGYNPWAGTKWDKMLNGGVPRLKPFQLTGYQQDQSNPRNWQPREIIVEYFDDFQDKWDLTGAGGTWNTPPTPFSTDNLWHEALRYDNLTLSADGTMVFLSALRDAQTPQSWVSQATAGPDGTGNTIGNQTYRGDTMRKRPLRIQLAIEGDWPITSLQGNGGGKDDDPNRIYDRVATGPRFCWQVTNQPGDYVEYLRLETSRPIGAANLDLINDGVSFPAKMSVNNELFTDRIDNNTGRIADHATARVKDVKRVEISASLEVEALAPAHRPGISMTLEGGDTIPVYGVIKTVILRSQAKSKEEGQTTVIVEPPETSAIYDQPKAGTYRSESPKTNSAAPAPSSPAPDSSYNENDYADSPSSRSSVVTADQSRPVSSSIPPAASAKNVGAAGDTGKPGKASNPPPARTQIGSTAGKANNPTPARMLPGNTAGKAVNQMPKAMQNRQAAQPAAASTKPTASKPPMKPAPMKAGDAVMNALNGETKSPAKKKPAGPDDE